MNVHIETLKIVPAPILEPKEDLFAMSDEQLLARKAARSGRMKIQAKHIRAEDMLALIEAINAIPKMYRRGYPYFEFRKSWANTWDIFALWPDIPPKVIMAKLRNLEKKGLIDGCTCGCYGGFTVIKKG